MSRGLEVGDRTPEFSLIGADGMIHTLDDYKGFKGVCFAFFADHEKLSTVAISEMEKLKADYAKKSIAFAGIYRKSAEESFSGVLEALKNLHLDIDVLLDGTGDLSRKFSIESYPTFFIFNQSKHLIYKGRAFEKSDDQTSVNYLSTALDELIGGLPISYPETNPEHRERETISIR